MVLLFDGLDCNPVYALCIIYHSIRGDPLVDRSNFVLGHVYIVSLLLDYIYELILLSQVLFNHNNEAILRGKPFIA